jgi:hypothetical protein
MVLCENWHIKATGKTHSLEGCGAGCGQKGAELEESGVKWKGGIISSNYYVFN